MSVFGLEIPVVVVEVVVVDEVEAVVKPTGDTERLG